MAASVRHVVTSYITLVSSAAVKEKSIFSVTGDALYALESGIIESVIQVSSIRYAYACP